MKLVIVSVVVILILAIGFIVLVTNPTGSPKNAPARLQSDRKRLADHVFRLASQSPPRSSDHADGLELAAEYIRSEWKTSGLNVVAQEFKADGRAFKNLMTSVGPLGGPRLVIGAHYDVFGELPGADDNASGIAGLLELGRLLKEMKPNLKHRVDLVAYTLEEPPYYATESMGSFVHAKSLKESKTEVKLMISLEMIGYFREEPNTQHFPVDLLQFFYPSRGNFISVVGNLSGWSAVRQVKQKLKQGGILEVCSVNAPTQIPGVDFSDHRNYWHFGYPAVMVTDTSFYRNKNYHTAQDLPATLDYDKMAQVVDGIYQFLTQP